MWKFLFKKALQKLDWDDIEKLLGMVFTPEITIEQMVTFSEMDDSFKVHTSLWYRGKLIKSKTKKFWSDGIH